MTDFSQVKNPYDVFLLPRNCTLEEIKKVFRVMSLREHPDRHQDPMEKAFYEGRFKEVKQAYEILMKERSQLDAFLNRRNTSNSATEQVRQERQYQTGTQADFNDYFRNRRTWTTEETAERFRQAQRERGGRDERRNRRVRRRNRKVGIIFVITIVIVALSFISWSIPKPTQTLQLTGSYNANTITADLQTMLNNPANVYCGLEENGLTTICYYDFDANGNYFAFSLEHNNWIYNQVVVDISNLPRTDIGSNHFAFLDMEAYNACLGTDGINTQCLNSQHNKLFSSGSSPKTTQGQTIPLKSGVVTQLPTGDKIQTTIPSIQDKISSNTKAYDEQFQKDLSRIHNCMKAGGKGIDQIPC